MRRFPRLFSMTCVIAITGATLLMMTLPAFGQNNPADPTREWVSRSNQNAQLLLKVFSRYNPEFASQVGVEDVDDAIIDLNPGFNDRANRDTRDAIQALNARLAAEKDPAVRQDLEILIKSAEDAIKGNQLNDRYLLIYFDIPQTIFQGMRSLLDEQVSSDRRKASLIRLRKYAGLEPGYKPITRIAEERIRESFQKPGLLGPIQAEVEKNLSNSDFYVDGIAELLKQYSMSGYDDTYAKLKQQIHDYNAFIRKEVLPRARKDFRLPPPLYQFALEQVGIPMQAADLAKEAHTAFDSIQKEMQDLAPRVSKEKGYSVTDYRDVIRELKKNQLVGEAILPSYEKRIQEIQEIIKREHLATLPVREIKIRLASKAESAQIPAPNMRFPRLLGNTGERGEFVLPLRVPAAPGSNQAMQAFDDFTFDAASWTLTAHEGRPGHEMQFDSIIEAGVSVARALFAFNSVNVEGWGLYSEAIMQPYEPPDGQLIALQHRLLRAARAFLDPELQMGKITPEQAKNVLMNDAVFSDAMATQEVERYTFRAPGQAPSYFYGYMQLMKLRSDVEKKMDGSFNQQKYHDFILHQGLLPPELLRKAVMDQFAGK